jgi:hypothetical protein
MDADRVAILDGRTVRGGLRGRGDGILGARQKRRPDMSNARLDHALVRQQVAKAAQHLAAAEAELAGILEVIDAEHRAACVRPRARFVEKGPEFAATARAFPDLAAAVKFDGDAVTEDVRNALALDGLVTKVDELQQRLADSRLVWLSDSYSDCLALYRVANSVMDPRTRELVAPFSELFPGRSRPRKAE